MLIKTVPINSLKPAEYNPRKTLKPGDVEYESLKKSVQEFGHVHPIVVNSDMTVIGGHQTLAVLKDLGRQEVSVSLVDLPKKKEMALNVALNKINGAWDYTLLKNVLVELDTGDFDLSLTGFSEAELGRLIDYEKETFSPGGQALSPLDERAKITCPSCGHEFAPN